MRMGLHFIARSEAMYFVWPQHHANTIISFQKLKAHTDGSHAKSKLTSCVENSIQLGIGDHGKAVMEGADGRIPRWQNMLRWKNTKMAVNKMRQRRPPTIIGTISKSSTIQLSINSDVLIIPVLE